MNKIVVSLGIILLVVLMMLGIFAYMNRPPAQTLSTSTPVAKGFRPLDSGSVSSTAVPANGHLGSIPYATTPTPAQSPTYQSSYQPSIVTVQPDVFSEPFTRSTQQSPAMSQQIASQQAQSEVTPPAIAESQPIQTPSATLSLIPSFAPYIPYNNQYNTQTYYPSSTSPIAGVTTGGGGGGGGGGSSEITSILVSLGTVAASALLGGMGGGGGMGGLGSGNFGGRITNVTYCTCSISLLLDINDVRGWTTSLLFSPGFSHLYAYYNIFAAGPEVLGTYIQSGGQCQVYDGVSCNSQGNPQGTIKIVGTSAQ